jgi:hypothetical protein
MSWTSKSNLSIYCFLKASVAIEKAFDSTLGRPDLDQPDLDRTLTVLIVLQFDLNLLPHRRVQLHTEQEKRSVWIRNVE